MQLGSMFISNCSNTLHVSDAICVHPQEHYTQYDLVRKPSTLDALFGYFTPSHVIHHRLLLQFFNWSWGWKQIASETCRVLLHLLIIILPSCITLVLYIYYNYWVYFDYFPVFLDCFFAPNNNMQAVIFPIKWNNAGRKVVGETLEFECLFTAVILRHISLKKLYKCLNCVFSFLVQLLFGVLFFRMYINVVSEKGAVWLHIIKKISKTLLKFVFYVT